MVTDTPFFSIITPCYNVERYLKECVSSVQRQTFKNWEMILVDDGSTDSTLSLCMELASKDERIIVFHQNNAGVSAARNKGLELSKGQWIIFIDSDDWFSDNAFDTFLKAIDEVKCDRYIFNRSSVNKGLKLPLSHLKPYKLIRSGKELRWFAIDMLYPYYDELINDVKVEDIRGVNCSVYNSHTIKTNKIKFDTNLKIAEDAIFNYDIIIHSKTIMMCDIDVGCYRINEGSVMHSYTSNINIINNQTINAYFARTKELIETDIDFKHAFVGMVSECLFRAMKLNLLHPSNKTSIMNRMINLKRLIKNNDLIKMAINNVDPAYLPHGKKEIMLSLKYNQYLISLLLGYLAILYLTFKKEI